MFDSGVGGLSVLSACKRELPNVSFLYLDDGENRPYGDKSREEVIDISEKCVRRLIGAGCNAVVVACNTATACAVGTLRKRFPTLPIIGTEPAVKPALASSDGKVLLLATPLTAKLKEYSDRVIIGEERTLASEIERVYPNPYKLAELAHAVENKYRGFSSIVTGCTHYAHLIPYFTHPVFDGADGVAKRLKNLLL